jgi:tetratricopeptide (TPR) repeat protein
MLTLAQRLMQGQQLHAAGRLAEAQALYRGILGEAPDHGEALHGLGLLLHQTGQHQEAIDLLGRSLVAHGPHPLIHSNLGAVYLAAGLLNEAAEQCRAAIRLHPGLAVAHFNLGAALRRQDRFEEAESAFRESVRLDPRDVDAHCNLAVVLHKLGKNPEALARLEATARLAPTHAQVHHDLGAMLQDLGQGERAVWHLRQAIRLKPDLVEAHDNLGLAVRAQNSIDEAIACFREALRLDPRRVKSRNNLGNALETQGKMDEAVVEFQEALRLDPHNAFATAALSNLAAAGHFRFSEEQIRAIAERVIRKDLPLEDRQPLHFALAVLFDRAGDYAQAFEHYRAGNDIRNAIERRRGQVFDPAAHDREVDRLIATFTPAYFERVRSFGLDTELPVFIVGMMRSGTTLAEQILASHPQVHGAGELGVVGTLINTLPQRLGATETFPEVMAKLDATVTRRVAEEHEQRLKEHGGAAARVVDKLPGNFLNLGFIATLFPRARIIHCRRDPVDTCLSNYIQNYQGSVPYTLDLVHLGRFYRAYERLMAHWASVLPMPVFELQYEEMTARQEEVSRRLVAFCGVDWDDRCLRFHETQRAVRTASLLQVRQPLYRSSVGRWKRYEAFLQPLIETLAGPRG